MPNVPQIRPARAPVYSPRGDPSAGVFEAVEYLADTATDFFKERTIARERQDISEREATLSAGLTELGLEFAKNPGDPTTMAERYADQAKVLAADSYKGAPPRVTEALKLSATELLKTHQISAVQTAFKLEVSASRAIFENKTLLELTKTIVDAPNPLAEDLGWEAVDASFDAAWWYSPHEKAKERADFEHDVDVSRVLSAIDNAYDAPPAQAAMFLATALQFVDDEESTPNLLPADRIRLRGTIGTAANFIEARTNTAIKEAEVAEADSFANRYVLADEHPENIPTATDISNSKLLSPALKLSFSAMTQALAEGRKLDYRKDVFVELKTRVTSPDYPFPYQFGIKDERDLLPYLARGDILPPQYVELSGDVKRKQAAVTKPVDDLLDDWLNRTAKIVNASTLLDLAEGGPEREVFFRHEAKEFYYKKIGEGDLPSDLLNPRGGEGTLWPFVDKYRGERIPATDLGGLGTIGGAYVPPPLHPELQGEPLPGATMTYDGFYGLSPEEQQELERVFLERALQ